MATEPVILRDEERRPGIPFEAFGRYAAIGCLAAGVVLLAGTFLDLGVLWLAQRQPSPQWEFVAIANTAEAFPRLLLGIALLYGALYCRRSTWLAGYRALGAALIVLGVAGAFLALLIVTDYFSLATLAVTPQSKAALRSTTFKAAALGGLYLALLLPLGMSAVRRPKGDS